MPTDFDKKALEIQAKLKQRENLIKEAVASLSVVLLMGHEEEKELSLFNRIKEELELELPVFMVKHASESIKSVNDLECEKTAIDEADIIVMIDGLAPGLVSESVLICQNEKYQNKTLLFVDENQKTFADITNLKLHYLWYPTIWLYKDKDDLVSKIKKIVLKTAYRKIHLKLRKIKKKDINQNDDNI